MYNGHGNDAMFEINLYNDHILITYGPGSRQKIVHEGVNWTNNDEQLCVIGIAHKWLFAYSLYLPVVCRIAHSLLCFLFYLFSSCVLYTQCC